MKINIATLNVKGVAGPDKFTKTANLLKTYKDIDIFTLQETNINIENIQKTTKKWPKDSFWTPHVAILINNRRIKITNIFTTSSRSMIMDFTLHSVNYRLETVYVPPDKTRRSTFLESWTPSLSHTNYILTGDFNLNLVPANRLNTSLERLDSTKNLLLSKLNNLIDTQLLASISSIQTFYQTVTGGRHIASKLDYIFLSPDLSDHNIWLTVRSGNSDHLMLSAALSSKAEFADPSQWKLNNSILKNTHILNKAMNICSNHDDWDTAKTSLKTYLSGASRLSAKNKKTEISRSQKRINSYEKTLILFPKAKNIASLLEKEKAHLNSLISLNSQKWQIKSKATWTEKGEKSTKYFYSRYMERISSSPTVHIQIPNRVDNPSSQQKLDYAASWFEQLYTPEPISEPDAHRLLGRVTPLTPSASAEIISPISSKEIQEVIKELPNNKVPGPDSIPYEFYKLALPAVTDIFETLFNDILKGSEIPTSWTKSYITLIPKKEEDKSEIKNWRPIALINSDAKIFLKILANRVGKAVNTILPEHQKEFLSGRNTIDATLNIIEAVSALKQDATSVSFLLQLDQQKTFDRVNHAYFTMVLNAFGLPHTFINISNQ